MSRPKPLFPERKNLAIFSPCQKYRYVLTRNFVFGKKDQVCFIGLNPSTATATLNDPTIRREMGYAMSWGFNRLVKLNLFAFRSTDPKQLYSQEDPIGEENDKYLKKFSKDSDLIIVAWGVWGDYLSRDKEVLKLLTNPHCLALTKDGFPAHPLYLKKNLKPRPYQV